MRNFDDSNNSPEHGSLGALMGGRAAEPTGRYRFFRGVINFVLRLYYSSIESYGQNFIPKRGRTLLIANHQAGLIDGLLVLGTQPQVIRTVIKHTLWENPVIGFFATGLGMIPVYRKQDLKPEEQSTSGVDRHGAMFSRVERAFKEHESILIFPEGVSHDNPHILKLRSGAARMMLQTEAAHDFRLGIQWLPVSLDLEVKDRPGSRVLIHYHPPRQLTHLRELYSKDPEAAIEKLRAEMEENLREITLNFSTWEDRLFLERLTEIWLCQAPNDVLLDRHNQLLKWKRVLELTRAHDSPDWRRLRAKVSALHHTLEIAGLKAHEIVDRNTEKRKRLTARLFPTMIFWAPSIVFGHLFWWLPTQAIKFVTAKGAQGYRDVVSTYHVVAALVLYPAWLVLAMFAAYYLGPRGIASVGLAIVAISSGLSLLISAQKLQVQIREILNMYRYNNLEELLDETEGEIREIWALAARIWNHALTRQVVIDESRGA